MSHGYAIALLTPEQASDVEASLSSLLAPYEECREVPEYQTPCYCVGGKARVAAGDEGRRVHGDEQTKRRRFGEFMRPHFGRRSYYDLDGREERERWDDLAGAFWDPIRATEQAAFEAHPDKNAAEPDCDECHGMGSRATTRNPMAKWDWFVVGGRWSNQLQGRDVAPVAEVDWDDDTLPRAIVTRTPAGWIERGRLGWFGSSKDRVERDEWRREARDLLRLAAERGDVAVVVDYHI
jgi:hypothetical protein